METKTAFADLPNPFDFAHPVRDQEQFFGRRDTLEETNYYVRHGRATGRPINLALVGARAAGKTSLLYMIEKQGLEAGFVVARVDLDESDSETVPTFIAKIFDAILSAACEAGAFGGLSGNTYLSYRDMVDTGEVPEALDFCPFSFPVQQAKAMTHGRSIAISDSGLRRDLLAIQNEVNAPIMILFDECDVLRSSQVHLQKLRNTFMACDGYMLVLAGTEALFPVMDSVFSPIIRQFKKIEVKPFARRADTLDCITKSIQRAGYQTPADVIDPYTAYEIHRLARGRPYEIQLICHIMFRRMQEGRARRMATSLDVLEDVRVELEVAQDVTRRGVIAGVRRLSRKELQALATLTECSGRATLEDIWFLRHAIALDDSIKREELSGLVERLVQDGVLASVDGRLAFEGDDFDRVYCRYFAEEREVALNPEGLPLDVAATLALDAAIEKTAPDVEGAIMPRIIPFDEAAWLNIYNQLIVGNTEPNPVDQAGSLAMTIYWMLYRLRGQAEVDLITLEIQAPWGRMLRQYVWRKPGGTVETTQVLATTALSETIRRCEANGGSAHVRAVRLPILPFERMADLVVRSHDEVLKRDIANEHRDELREAYTERKDFESALDHARCGLALTEQWSGWNDYGYLLMARGDFESAAPVLEKALAMQPEPSDRALSEYNAAVTQLMIDKKASAISYLERALVTMAGPPEAEPGASCVLEVMWDANAETWGTTEVVEPRVRDLAKELLERLR